MLSGGEPTRWLQHAVNNRLVQDRKLRGLTGKPDVPETRMNQMNQMNQMNEMTHGLNRGPKEREDSNEPNEPNEREDSRAEPGPERTRGFELFRAPVYQKVNDSSVEFSHMRSERLLSQADWQEWGSW